MRGSPLPRHLRDRMRPVGAPVPHPGAFPTAPLPEDVEHALALFTEACEAVGGRVSRTKDVHEVVDLAASYLEAPDFRRENEASAAPFVSWDAAHLPLPELPDLLERRGAERRDAIVGAEQPARDHDHDRVEGAVLGITGAHAALADTGSVVLVHGAGRPRLVSLLPPVHLVLVPVAALHATLGSLLRDAPDLFRHSANVVVVTGPSRTADIELTLTRGVHGPRFVHVVFVG